MRFRLLSIFVLALTALGALPLSLAQPPAALDGTQWQLISLDGSPVLDSTSVTLAFGPQDRAGGSGGCNSYGGSYSVQDDALSFGPLASTMMACHDDVMQQELDYFAALQAVTRFTRSGDQLILFYGEGQQLIFARLATLANTRWQLESLDGAAPIGETALTLEFDAENGVSGFSGCNSYGGTYEASLGRILFGDLFSTLMACVDEALMQQEMAFLQALQNAVAYSLAEDRLTLTTSEGQTLVFARVWSLADTRWQLESLDDAAPAGEAPLTLEFDAAGRVSGSSGCNRFSASYALEGDALRFGPIASTKMACLDEALMQQEMAYLAALEAVTHYEQSTESLVIFYGEEQRLIFVPLAE